MGIAALIIGLSVLGIVISPRLAGWLLERRRIRTGYVEFPSTYLSMGEIINRHAILSEMRLISTFSGSGLKLYSEYKLALDKGQWKLILSQRSQTDKDGTVWQVMDGYIQHGEWENRMQASAIEKLNYESICEATRDYLPVQDPEMVTRLNMAYELMLRARGGKAL